MSKLSAEEIERRTALVNQGLSNKEIADICGCSAAAISSWKIRRGKAFVKDALIADKKGWSYGEYSSERAGRPVRHRTYPKPEWTPLVVKI